MSALDHILTRATPIDCADFLSITLGPYLDSIKNGTLPLLLFGAGSACTRLAPLFHLHGVYPKAILDNDSSKHFSDVHKIPVMAPSLALTQYPGGIIVIAMGRNHDAVRQQLTNLGVSRDKIRTIPKGPLYFYTNFFNWYMSQEDMIKHNLDIECVFNLFSDSQSKNLYIDRISLFSGGADYRSYASFVKMYSPNQLTPTDSIINAHARPWLYFDWDFIHLKENEIFVDCGAYDGDTAQQFMLRCKHLGVQKYHVYCLEPDKDNYSRLMANLALNPCVCIYNLGVWSEPCSINFVPSSWPDVAPPTAHVTTDETGYVAQMECLDNLFSHRRVTFIKMDVEGAEKEALLGAKQVLRRWKPKLAISVYHKRYDILQIPLLIEHLCPGYQFYLRHLGDDFLETVLFAI